MKEPDSTAIRVALWRALHMEVDSPPIFQDDFGLKLIQPDSNWRERPDMNPKAVAGYRASIVARAKFVEDFVEANPMPYIILGAGLDTFAQRKPELAAKCGVYEVDQPDTQAWKKDRLRGLGIHIPSWLHFIPVDFENGAIWLDQLRGAGFDSKKPAIVASTGVAMYLTKEAVVEMFGLVTKLAPGTTLLMTFLLPLDLMDPEDRAPFQAVMERAKAAGTPFLSFFPPDQMLALAKEAGFSHAEYIRDFKKYFTGREDGLMPASGEAMLVARV